MGREGIESYEKIFECQILDKYNLTDRKVPAVTVKGGYLRFNLNAIHLLNDTPFVELLINPDEKYMLVVPCGEFDVSAVDWCKVALNLRISAANFSRPNCTTLWGGMPTTPIKSNASIRPSTTGSACCSLTSPNMLQWFKPM